MISMIWAMDESKLIGASNKMPWHCKEDLLYFKSKTKDSTVVMGYNTYLSMTGYYKNRPFPFKKTYVLAHHYIDDERVQTATCFDELLKLKEDFFVVGGRMIYELFFPYASYLYITYIKGVHSGDTYMDFLDLSEFKLVSENITDEAKYTIYERKK